MEFDDDYGDMPKSKIEPLKPSNKIKPADT
jgi:hypothetical protein